MYYFSDIRSIMQCLPPLKQMVVGRQSNMLCTFCRAFYVPYIAFYTEADYVTDHNLVMAVFVNIEATIGLLRHKAYIRSPQTQSLH